MIKCGGRLARLSFLPRFDLFPDHSPPFEPEALHFSVAKQEIYEK